jgi:MFS superfamily sulfate permease-like transporter
MTGLFATVLVGMVVGLAVGVAASGVLGAARATRKADSKP